MKLKSAGFSFCVQYSKPTLTYSEQLQRLTQRGLICTDQTRALEWLQRIGYHRLSAYFTPFRDSKTDTFRSGTTFGDIVDLYKFDGGLRLLTMQAMDRIEVAIRSVIAYELANTLCPFGYADPSNFDPTFDHAWLMKLIAKEERRSSEASVDRYRTKYTSEPHLPVWMATELISFGTLSQMYANLRSKLRKQIARRLNQETPVFLSWLHALTAIRNVCAHHSRLWDKELSVKPVLPNAWKANEIENHRFYVLALIIQTLLLEVSPHSLWKERLKSHLDAYPSVDWKQKHFPLDWHKSDPWV